MSAGPAPPHPAPPVRDRGIRGGLRHLLVEGALANAMGSLTGGAILVAFAVAMGASSGVVAAIAALGQASQILQIPAVGLVERVRHRKHVVLLASGAARVSLLLIAGIPWLVAPEWRISALLILFAAHSGFGAVSACASTSWQRDFVPEVLRNGFFGRRLALTTAVGAGLTLLVALTVGRDVRSETAEPEMLALLFALGAGIGLVGLAFIARIPEPLRSDGGRRKIMQVLAEPFQDRGYRLLLMFTGAWSFASNLAAPFFTLYMLRRLDMTVGAVLVLTVLSQMSHVLVSRPWGRLADRFGKRAVLGVSTLLFFFSVLVWPFTSAIQAPALRVVVLGLIHVLMGMATAGLLVSSSSLAMTMAPRGRATAFLAANTLVAGAAAAVAPLLAGAALALVRGMEVGVVVRAQRNGAGAPEGLWLTGLDFAFIAAFAMGQYALHRLTLIHDGQEVRSEILMRALRQEVGREVRQVTSIAGMRQFTSFPFALLRERVKRRDRPPAAETP